MLLGHPNLDPYAGYNSSVDPNVDFMFNSVALRYGHTQVNDITWRLNEDRTFAAGGNISLKLSFFQPAILLNEGCSPIFRGLNAKAHNSPEVNLVDTLQDFLFAKAGSFGNDLIATNMRRARETGLPNYNTARQIYGLPPMTDFSFTGYPTLFENAYGTTDPTNCDPWMCGILENGPTPDGELGDLFYNIVKRQFQRTRDSDRFWYSNNQFSSLEYSQLNQTRLVDIILRNSNVQQLKCSIFEVPNNINTGPLCYRGNDANANTPFTVTTSLTPPATTSSGAASGTASGTAASGTAASGTAASGTASGPAATTSPVSAASSLIVSAVILAFAIFASAL